MPPGEQSGYVSYCHPWSSGVAPWLLKWSLGVRPLEPGYGRVLIAPHVGRSMRAGVRGSAATPAGAVSVDAAPAAAADGGGALVAVALPRGVAARLQLSSTLLARLGVRLPPAPEALGAALAALVVETRSGGGDNAAWLPASAQLLTSPADTPLLNEDDAGSARAPALVLELSGGSGSSSHEVRVRTRGAPAAAPSAPDSSSNEALPWAPLTSPFPPPAWPGTFLRSDATTKGDWAAASYGRDGFVLIGFDVQGRSPQDRVRLPPYVSSAVVVNSQDFSGARFNWVTDGAGDKRTLVDPSNSTHRALGLMQPHHDCPTAPFDVQLTDAAIAAGTRYRLSLYFVDFGPSPEGTFDGSARAQEVYLLEGYPDFSPKAPREVLRDFAGGVWLSWEIVGSVRVRISSISGNYAALSAVMFDPAE